MPRISTLFIGVSTVTATLYFTALNHQQRQNLYGSYLSIVSSCRSAWIVYTSYHDYQNSLNHLTYNSD